MKNNIKNHPPKAINYNRNSNNKSSSNQHPKNSTQLSTSKLYQQYHKFQQKYENQINHHNHNHHSNNGSSLKLNPHEKPKNKSQLKKKLFMAQIDEIQQQLKYSTFLKILNKFQSNLYQMMTAVMKSIMTLELKIAGCQNHFNAIQLQLAQKCRQMRLLSEENKTLVDANKQIEEALAGLKLQYQMNREKDRNQGIQASINRLSSTIQQKQQLINQHTSIQQQVLQVLNRIDNHLNTNNSRNTNSTNTITTTNTNQTKYNIFPQLKQLIKQLALISTSFDTTLTPSIAQYTQNKILQNIDLKFQLLNYQRKLLNKQQCL